MVLSRLNKTLKYSEKKTLDRGDINYKATLYKIVVENYKITIALGDTKYDFSEKKILFVYIYLIKNNKIFNKIGVYEFESESFWTLLDDDNDLDVTKMNNPLFFKFVTHTYLKRHGFLIKGKTKEEEE